MKNKALMTLYLWKYTTMQTVKSAMNMKKKARMTLYLRKYTTLCNKSECNEHEKQGSYDLISVEIYHTMQPVRVRVQ